MISKVQTILVENDVWVFGSSVLIYLLLMSILIGIHFKGLASNELFINQSSNLWKSRFKPFFMMSISFVHDDVIKWKHFPRYQVTAFCAGNSSFTGEFPAQRPVTRSFDVFLHLCLKKKRLSKQASGWWFETPSHLLWHHCYQIRLTKGTQASIYPRGTRTTFQYLTSRFWHHIYWHVGNYVVYYTKVYKRAVKHHRQNVWLSR